MEKPQEAYECKLLSGGFAAFVQVALGFIAVSVLLVKRQLESPRRAFQVWIFDAAKQMVGAGFAHVGNLAIAILLYEYTMTRHHSEESVDQCALYFVNFTLDTTIGVFLNYLLLRTLTAAAHRFGWSSLQKSGDYGSPIQIRIWLIQLFSWIILILLVKVIIAMMILCVEAPLEKIAHWLFEPLHSYPKAELVIVMIACPCLMNGIQFWIQDNFLKNDIRDGSELTATASPSGLKRYPISDLRSAIAAVCKRSKSSETEDENAHDDQVKNTALV